MDVENVYNEGEKAKREITDFKGTVDTEIVEKIDLERRSLVQGLSLLGAGLFVLGIVPGCKEKQSENRFERFTEHPQTNTGRNKRKTRADKKKHDPPANL